MGHHYLAPLRGRLSPSKGAAYVEYLILISASMAVALGSLFILLPRLTATYDTAAATTQAFLIPAGTGHPGTPSGGGTLPDGGGGLPDPIGGGSTPITPPGTGVTPGTDTPPAPGPDIPPTDPTPLDPPVVPDPPVTDPNPVDPPVVEEPVPPTQPSTPPPPVYAPFDFGERTLAWNNTTWRITSPYVDIDGVADVPVPYTVTGTGNPAAQANVPGGPSPASALYHGTDLQIDAPAPGGTHVGTLHIDGRSGSFRVRTLPIPDQTIHHGGQLWLWVPVHWQGRSFSISGQGQPGAQPNGGNVRPSATLPNGRITHGVSSNGFNLVIDAPPPGGRHRIILTIDGQTSSFDLIRP